MDKLCDFFNMARKVEQPITEQDAEREQQILKEFECPVCLTYAAPPIFMCINSHIICVQCWDRCPRCPTCRTPKSFTRALTLEKIHPMLSFPCKYDGCPFRSNGTFTQDHEITCKYYPIRCPLLDAYDCSWYGPIGLLRSHLIDTHRSNVYFDPGIRLVSRGFRHATKKSYALIFCCYEQIFRFTWEYDSAKSPVAVFSMVQIGSRSRHDKYQYTVAFSRHFPITVNSKKSLVMQSSVSKNYREDGRLGENQSNVSQWGISFNHLSSFCTRHNGDLYYEVIIRKHYGPVREHEILSLEEYEFLVED